MTALISWTILVLLAASFGVAFLALHIHRDERRRDRRDHVLDAKTRHPAGKNLT